MKKYIMLCLLLVLSLLFAQTSFDTKIPLPVDPDLIVGKLGNGLTYYIKVNHKPENRAELRLVTNIGSVQEDDDQQGLAHFTEHMAFNGTKHFQKSELVDYLNSIGMGYANGLNGGTGMDQTVYQLQIPTDNKEQFSKGFLILSDWASGVEFDSLEIDKERGVIIEEWRMGQGAEQRIYDAQRKVMFAGSKYAERMPIGQLDVLQHFKPATIKRFYHDWYRPDLQAVVAVGDFKASEVESLIKEYFGDIPARINPRPVLLYDVPDNLEPKVVITTDKEAPDTEVQIMWKHDITENKTISDYRATLVTNLYTQMLNSRLQELAQKADPPFIGAYNFKYNIVRSKSTYAMMAIVPETGILTGLQALLSEAERVNRFGFTESELVRAKQAALRNADRMLAEKDKQDSGRLVWKYVGNFIYGNPLMSVEQNVQLNRELYEGISVEDVNQVCRELVTDKNMIIAISGPEKEGLVMPPEEDVLGLVAQVKSEELEPYEDKFSNNELLQKELKPGKIASAKTYKKTGIKQWKLKNGITILYKQTDFKNDEILMKAFSPGGTSLYNMDDLFDAREAAGIISESGIDGFDDSTLQKKLAGKIVRVEPYINSENEGFTANTSKADLETMFQLVYLYATEPRLDQDSYSSWLTKERASLQNESLDPQTSFFDSLSAFFYDHNPRVRTMKLEDLASLDRERILQIYRERFADFTDFTFIFVGSFDEQQLQDLCLKYLANLPAKGVEEQVKDNGVRFTSGKKLMTVYKGQDDKSVVDMAIHSDCKLNGTTGNKLRNLTFLMDEKLRENIREARGGVYFVGSWGTIDKYPVPSYQIDIYMQCAPERVLELTDAVISTLDSLKAGNFSEKYVNVVKVTRQKRFETDIKENRWWLNSMYDQAWNGFDMNDLLEDKTDIDNLNLKELQDIAAEFLKQDTRLVKGILYPAALEK